MHPRPHFATTLFGGTGPRHVSLTAMRDDQTPLIVVKQILFVTETTRSYHSRSTMGLGLESSSNSRLSYIVDNI